MLQQTTTAFTNGTGIPVTVLCLVGEYTAATAFMVGTIPTTARQF